MKIINNFKSFFNQCNITWAICGGIAIDLFIGKQTRLHKDLDISVFWEDRDIIIEYMLNNQWTVFEPDNGKLREITSVSNDYRTIDNIWCLSKHNKTYTIEHLNDNYYDITCNTQNQDNFDFIEFLFNTKKDNQFLYKRNHNITLTLKDSLKTNKEGIPYLSPELVLLYKSTFINYLTSQDLDIIKLVNNYRHDFNVCKNHMSKNQLTWLINALKISYPAGHEWICNLHTL